MIQRIQARISCLAHGLKVLNLCILFLLLSQIRLVTRQLKYLISFVNSYILIEAASVHGRCCQYKHSPNSSLCRAVVSTPSFWLQTNTTVFLTFISLTFRYRKRDVSLGILYRKKIVSDLLSSLKKLFDSQTEGTNLWLPRGRGVGWSVESGISRCELLD